VPENAKAAPVRQHAQWRRFALDLGPLLLFFGTFQLFGIFAATGTFMAAVVAALAAGFAFERRILPMPLVTCLLVILFGGLTLYLKNDTFIKMKPTVLYASFGLVLIGGLAFNRLFIKYVLAEAFDLSERGWRALTWRWAIFFLFLAALNEVVWRHYSTGTWVWFKVAGVLPLTLMFAFAQVPFVIRHQLDGDSSDNQPVPR
jgi:intracellular septation protein